MKFNIEGKVLDSINTSILAVNQYGLISYANKNAQLLLLLPNKIEINHNINILNILPEIKDAILNHKDLVNKDIVLQSLKNNYICEILPFIYESESDGYIILIREGKRILRTANSYKNSATRYTFDSIIGKSPQIQSAIEQCKAISQNHSTVLIAGESGCGKELFAQSIHNASPRANDPFIAVNCGAIPKNLIESELFGYEGGAFTGSSKGGAAGKFELANGGTIFLDEIGEMPLDMQVHLLRVLQERKIPKIGSKAPIDVDIRVIAATNKDLKEEVNKGRFRSDLYYRLNVIPIKIPPLKDRIGDIPILLDYFLKEKSKKLSKEIPNISQDLFKKLITYCWPGNIREFENFVENLVALNGITSYQLELEDCHCLTYDNLGNRISEENNNEVNEHLESESVNVTPLILLEQQEIKKALQLYNGNMTKVSKALGISRNALYNKVNRYNIK